MKAMRRSTVLLAAALATAWPTSGCGLLLPLVTQLTRSQAVAADDSASPTSAAGASKRPGGSAKQAGLKPTSSGGNATPGEAGGSNLSSESGGATGAGAPQGDGGTSGGSAGFAGSGGGHSNATQPTTGLGSPSGASGGADRGSGTITVNAATPPKAGNALDDYIEDVRKSISQTTRNN